MNLGFLFLNFSEVVLPVLRNIVLARFLTPDQYGVAIGYIVLFATVEMLFDLGLNVQAVRSAAAGRSLGALHTAGVVRSLCAGVLALAVSPFVTDLYGFSSSWLLTAVLCLPMFVRSFENLGVKGLAVEYRYWPDGLSVFLAQGAFLVVSVGGAMLTGSGAWVVAGLLAQYVAYAASTQVLSPTRWQLGRNREDLAEVWSFGRPLLINGWISAVAFSDRMLVGSAIDPASLALYSALLTFLTLPKTLGLKLVGSLVVPLYINMRKKENSPQESYTALSSLLTLLSFIYAAAFVVVVPFMMPLLFGSFYAPDAWLTGAAAVLCYVRLAMLIPLGPLFAEGRTGPAPVANAIAGVALACAAPVLFWTKSLTMFVFAVAAFELVGLVIFLFFVGRVYFRGVWPALIVSLSGAIVLVLCVLLADNHLLAWGLMFAFGLVLASDLFRSRPALASLSSRGKSRADDPVAPPAKAVESVAGQGGAGE